MPYLNTNDLIQSRLFPAVGEGNHWAFLRLNKPAQRLCGCDVYAIEQGKIHVAPPVEVN